MDQIAGYDHKVGSNDISDVHEPVQQFNFLRIATLRRTNPIPRYMGIRDMDKGMFGRKGFDDFYIEYSLLCSSTS